MPVDLIYVSFHRAILRDEIGKDDLRKSPAGVRGGLPGQLPGPPGHHCDIGRVGQRVPCYAQAKGSEINSIL